MSLAIGTRGFSRLQIQPASGSRFARAVKRSRLWLPSGPSAFGDRPDVPLRRRSPPVNFGKAGNQTVKSVFWAEMEGASAATEHSNHH